MQTAFSVVQPVSLELTPGLPKSAPITQSAPEPSAWSEAGAPLRSVSTRKYCSFWSAIRRYSPPMAVKVSEPSSLRVNQSVSIHQSPKLLNPSGVMVCPWERVMSSLAVLSSTDSISWPLSFSTENGEAAKVRVLSSMANLPPRELEKGIALSAPIFTCEFS